MQYLGELKRERKKKENESSSSTVGYPVHEVVSPGTRKIFTKTSLGGRTPLRDWTQ